MLLVYPLGAVAVLRRPSLRVDSCTYVLLLQMTAYPVEPAVDG